MKAHAHKWVIFIVLLMAIGLLAACGGSDSSQPQEATPSIDSEALLEQRCSACHALTRVTSKVKSLEQWEATITDMIDKGARLNAEEKDALVKYMAENYGP
jgi:hypothetical protein